MAAEKCRVAQPSLSAQLVELENHIGLRLFERSTRKVLVSKEGAAFLALAQSLLSLSNDLRGHALNASDPSKGEISLGVIPTVAPHYLPVIAPFLRKEAPLQSVRWVEEKTDKLVEMLDNGELDAAILAMEPKLESFGNELLFRDPFRLAVAKSHPLGKRPTRRITLADLEGTDMLLLDEGHCLRDQALPFCSKARTHELELRATSLVTLIEMVSSGFGVTLLPELVANAEKKRGDLLFFTLPDPVPHRTIALYWRTTSPRASMLRAIAKSLRQNGPKSRGRKNA